MIPDVLAQIQVPPGWGRLDDLVVLSAVRSGTGAAIVEVGPAAGPPVLVVKLPPSQGAAGLHRAATAMRALRDDQRLGDLAPLIPAPLGDGAINGQAYAVEGALPGIDGNLCLAAPGARVKILLDAAAAIGRLHHPTCRTVTVDAATLHAWTDGPARVVAEVAADPGRVAAVAGEIRRAFAGRQVLLSWIHGDYWPGNLLLAPDDGAVAGIVDWEWAIPDALPLHDLLHLVVYTRMEVGRVEMGTVVRSLLDGAVWDPVEERILDCAPAIGPREPALARAMLQLFWLRHVSLSLVQSPQYARSWVWLARNVDQVLAAT